MLDVCSSMELYCFVLKNSQVVYGIWVCVFSSRNLTYDIVILTMFHVIVSAVSGHRDVTTRYHLKFLNYLVSSHCLCLNNARDSFLLAEDWCHCLRNTFH
jgi:hypothetical protein